VPRNAGARHRILVIDDEPLVCRAAARILRAYDVTTAGSAAAAIPLLLAEPPFDLVLSDLMMPDTTGIDLFHTICGLVPAYTERMRFMTGGACTDEAADFLARMTGRYIEKPFSADKLRALVEDWCA
jgi:DNA-binding NtrC family response regulator